MATATELPVNSAATATQMAQAIFGGGMTVNSASYSGDPLSSGIYSSGDTVSPGVVPADTGVILSTGYVADFTNNSGSTNTNTATDTGTNTAGINGDADFNSLSGGAPTRDASFLEVNFTPTGDMLTVDFVISSEEYPEYINSEYLDVVGLWVNGVQATVTVGNGQASVGNINGNTAPNLYNDNTADQYNTEMDGFTVKLSFTAPVNAGVPNTLKIGVADVSDSFYDTNLLIAGGSVQSSFVAQDDTITYGFGAHKTLDVLANDSSTAGSLTVTHINGQAVVAGDTVTLSTGQQITLNADGTFTILGDADPETVYFNYTVQDGAGDTDTAIVEINQVPCFVAGTLIDTVEGPRPIETLAPGDMVLTRDGGAQPLKWVGTRTVAATGSRAPVCIRKGSFGATRDVYLSPQHRVLLRDVWAELMFGEAEVLVKAKDLINGKTVTRVPGSETVTYVHLLFDRHHIVTCSGLASESYLPGPMTMRGFDAGTQDELLALFPQLGLGNEPGWTAARPLLRSHEARALLNAVGRWAA